MEITREIMWNIPHWMKLSMYGMLVVATLIFIKGWYEKYQFVTKNHSLSSLFPHQFNFKQFLKTIFFQGKVTRNLYVAIFHSLIFYGFIILWIATDLVAIHYDTPFKVFQGTTYKVISLLADIAGVAILIGLGLAYYRRYILKPSYLSSTKPKSEIFMYTMLFLLVIVGFLLEGIRIVGTGFPHFEQLFSPVGWYVALVIQSFAISDITLSNLYQALWFFHMANTMVFLASIPYSKFSHIFLIPISNFLTPERRGAVLEPMDFEDENAESFGLGSSNELTAKQRLDTQTCVECGRCTQVCPALAADKPLDPKLIVTKLRDHLVNEKDHSISLWEESTLYSNNELDSCTTCGACMEECPAGIEHVNLIMDLKRYKALTLGEIPPAAADAVNKIKVNGNPWGVSQEDRFKWADGLDVPVINEGVKVDYLYYVGCAGSYDASNQAVVKDTVSLLKKAGVNFAVMGKTEKCNGDPVRRFGDEYSFFEIAIENISNMRKYQFDKVVTHCPHCLHTIGKEYAKFENGSFETIHHTELLVDLVKTGKLIPKKQVDEDVTFHDPCYLGRHHGEYDAPREILKSIPGLKLQEMQRSKEKSLCCGMGGGNMWYEISEGKDLAENRLIEVGETKAAKLATSCSFCMINFNSGKGKVATTENLNIEDVSQILAKSIE